MTFKRLFMYKRGQHRKQCRFLLQRTGQVTVELILILVIFVGITTLIKSLMGGVAKDLIQAPWQQISGMIESGNWEKTKDKAKQGHPGIPRDPWNNRHISVKGEKIP